MNQSFIMEPATATDVCDGMFKSKNITVHGNATVVKQTGPKLVYSIELWKTLEVMTIVEEKCRLHMLEECFISLQSQLANEKVQLKSKKVQLKMLTCH